MLRADWLKTWAAAAALALLLLGGWEALWRARGFRPAVVDDARLWAAARRRVKADSTVLVGSSRMHADVRPSTFAAEAGGADTVQLAVSGGMSYPVLESLAGDPSFRGTVVCELMEVEIATGLTTRTEKDFVGAYEHQSPASRAEASLQRLVQEHFAYGLPQLALPSVSGDLLRGRLPESSASASAIGADRTLSVDFGKVDVAKLRDKVASLSVYQGPEISPEEFVARARRFEELAARIERRGGRVVFVRMPVSGVLWERLEAAYPKAAYWDELARRTRFRTVHFRDYPGLRVECPDGSHLDMRDAPRFTEALARIIFPAAGRAGAGRRPVED